MHLDTPKPATLAALLALLLAPAAAYSQGDVIEFADVGFEIGALQAPSDGVNYQPVLMALPPTEGFAANVNVQAQVYPGSLAEYAELSRGQFESMGWKVLHENLTKTSVTWEFTGDPQGRALHFYAKAVGGDGKVFLATATATPGQWKRYASALKRSVDRLALTSP